MSQKVLWRPYVSHGKSAGESSTIKRHQKHDDEEEFHRIRNLRCMHELLGSQASNNINDDYPSSLIVTTPPHRPLIEIVSRSLVVGQEVALAAILLAVHREIVDGEEHQTRLNRQPELDMSSMTSKSSLVMLIVYATLFIIVYYNRQSLAHDRENRHRRKRAIVRLSDGMLLAALLRFMSGVLRTLTASYSSDTVYALAISGMAIHLLACDYQYANGVQTADETDGRSSLNALSDHPRPPFLGGTVALNAVFFSTVLLVSRIRSNATSYAFVSSVVVLFAFYPGKFITQTALLTSLNVVCTWL
ncbi:hypothetical protein ACHAWF_013133 [Thalassiosira exigua]